MTTEQKPVVAWLVRRKDWPAGTYGAQVGEVRPTWADEAFPLFLQDPAAGLQKAVAWLARDGAGQLFIINGDGPHDVYGGFPVFDRTAPAAGPQQGDVPDGYMLVMVPEIQPQDEPDWDECIRQAEVATGLKVERNTLSIVIREVRRWLAGRSAGPQQGEAAQPLTDEQRRALWRASEFRGNGGQIDWFIEGTRAAERHHRIGIQPAATKGTT